MNNQERNRDALIEHIAEQDRIIRRRNEQIANQAQNAREDQKAIEELDARNKSLVADLAAAVARADKAERERDEVRDAWEGAVESVKEANSLINSLRAAESRPLTPDAITDEMERRAIRKGIEFGWFLDGDVNVRDVRKKTRAILESALGIPTRPEGAEGIQDLIREAEEAGEGADNETLANYLAARILDPTVKEQA